MRLITALLVMMLIMPYAYAHEEAGVNVDRPILHSLDRAIDAIRIALTFNAEKKAEVSLQVAQERLEEVREMMTANRTDLAEKAMRHYESRMSGMGLGNVRNAKTVLRMQTMMDQMGVDLDSMNETMGIMGRVNGFRNRFADGTNLHSAMYKVMSERLNETISELSEEEIAEIEQLRAGQMINTTQNRIEFAQKLMQRKAEKYNTTTAEDYLTRAIQKLDEARQFYEQSDYTNATIYAHDAMFIVNHAGTGVNIEAMSTAMGRMHGRAFNFVMSR